MKLQYQTPAFFFFLIETIFGDLEDMATHSSVLGWRIPMDRGAWRATVHGVAESQTRLTQLSTAQHTELRTFMCFYSSTVLPCLKTK